MLTKVNRTVLTIAILATLLIGVEILDEETERKRYVTITVTWTQHPKREGPGHIDVVGKIGPNKFMAESTAENPFIEAGRAYPGEPVQVQAWATDGPFAAFDCSITGASVLFPPLKWEGLRVMCSGKA